MRLIKYITLSIVTVLLGSADIYAGTIFGGPSTVSTNGTASFSGVPFPGLGSGIATVGTSKTAVSDEYNMTFAVLAGAASTPTFDWSVTTLGPAIRRVTAQIIGDTAGILASGGGLGTVAAPPGAFTVVSSAPNLLVLESVPGAEIVAGGGPMTFSFPISIPAGVGSGAFTLRLSTNPEPGSLALAGICLCSFGGVTWWRRRRKSAAAV